MGVEGVRSRGDWLGGIIVELVWCRVRLDEGVGSGSGGSGWGIDLGQEGIRGRSHCDGRGG